MIKITEEEIVRVMTGVINQFLIPKFIDLGMNATGKWVDSLEARANNGNGEIWGMFYTEFLTKGRKPGKRPPISALIPWVQAKFGITGKESVGIAFAVSNKIAAEGTSYYPAGTDLLEVLTSSSVNEYINEEISAFLSVEISKELKRQLYDLSES